MVLVQKWLSYQLFLLDNKGQKSTLYDILERKNGFLGYKNKRLKKSKNWHFSKVRNPWFWSKNGHFSNFCFSGKIGQAKVFCDMVERKNAFPGYKNTKLKKSKNWHFSKGVHPWFWSKNNHFSHFFLGNIGQANVFSDILGRKNAFLGYTNKKLKNRKIDIFPKGLTHAFRSKMAIFPTFFLGNKGQKSISYDILEREKGFQGY